MGIAQTDEKFNIAKEAERLGYVTVRPYLFSSSWVIIKLKDKGWRILKERRNA